MYTDCVTEAILEEREVITLLVSDIDEAKTELQESFLLKLISASSENNLYSKGQYESFEIHTHRKLLIVHLISIELVTKLKRYKNDLDYVIDNNKKQEPML